jgi:hypothetical protein
VIVWHINFFITEFIASIGRLIDQNSLAPASHKCHSSVFQPKQHGKSQKQGTDRIRLQAFAPYSRKGGKLDEPSGGGHATADRKWLLDTYAECLRTVQNPSRRKSHMSARSFKVRLAKAGAGDHTAGGLR